MQGIPLSRKQEKTGRLMIIDLVCVWRPNIIRIQLTSRLSHRQYLGPRENMTPLLFTNLKYSSMGCRKKSAIPQYMAKISQVFIPYIVCIYHFATALFLPYRIKASNYRMYSAARAFDI